MVRNHKMCFGIKRLINFFKLMIIRVLDFSIINRTLCYISSCLILNMWKAMYNMCVDKRFLDKIKFKNSLF
jgi:hypothetical protein